jgi:hypothetical protein
MWKRRLASGGALLASLLLLLPGESRADGSALPVVTGPIEGGVRGRPFTTSHVDLAPHGYVEEEYFLEGRASRHAPKPGTSLSPDGAWQIETSGAEPYKTRLLVRRPKDPERFNGTLLVEWMNVSGGVDIDADWPQTFEEILRGGYVWAGVSAQRAAVNGMAPTELMPVVPPPLTAWDPQRYGGLMISDDALSYDIFSQAGRALSVKRRGSPDPLGTLEVERIVAMGASQSAHRLASYVNAAHLLVKVYDGYLIHVRFGRGAALGPEFPTPATLVLRTDLDVPILAVNTESEAIAHLAARREDDERFRYWEIAGASHQDAYITSVVAAQFKRDLAFEMQPCDRPINTLPGRYVMAAALRGLDQWIRGGEAPASLPRLAISGTPPAIERDEYGNARGGLRLPQIEVPTASYGPENSPGACRLNGSTVPFGDDTLRELYRTREVYSSRYRAAALTARDRGFLLEEDLPAVLSEAEALAASW